MLFGLLLRGLPHQVELLASFLNHVVESLFVVPSEANQLIWEDFLILLQTLDHTSLAEPDALVHAFELVVCIEVMQVQLVSALIAEERLLVFWLGLEALPLIDCLLIDADLSAELIPEAVHLHEVFLDVLSHHLMNELEHWAILPCHGGEHEIS